MNRQDRGALVGMVLGDGYIRTQSAADNRAKRSVSPQLYIAHSVDQKRYLQWKAGILNRVLGGKVTVRHYDYRHLPGGSKKVQVVKSAPYLGTLKGMMYQNGVKKVTRQVLDMLTVQGIAIWFMDDGSYRMNRRDDGSVSSISLELSTEVTKDEALEIQKYFWERHNIEWKLTYNKRTTYWSMRTNTENARKLAQLIGGELVPSMRYKIACVHQLKSQERLAPDKQCKRCKKTFGALKAKGLCMKCYNDEYFRQTNQMARTCSICGQTKTGYFCGNRCIACYQRQRKQTVG